MLQLFATSATPTALDGDAWQGVPSSAAGSRLVRLDRDRPLKANTCGVRFSHAFAIWLTARKLRPTTIIESGIFAGISTYFFRAAAPQAEIISIDPLAEPFNKACGAPPRWVDRTNNLYLTGPNFRDFAHVNWTAWAVRGRLQPSTTLVFFDDHQYAYHRIAFMRQHGFRHAIIEDNFASGRNGEYGWALKNILSINPKGKCEGRRPLCGPEVHDSCNVCPVSNWLVEQLRSYAEIPPLLFWFNESEGETEAAKIFRGGVNPYAHLNPLKTELAAGIAEPILRPDVRPADAAVLSRIGRELQLSAADRMYVSEFFFYNYIAYVEVAHAPRPCPGGCKLWSSPGDPCPRMSKKSGQACGAGVRYMAGELNATWGWRAFFRG